MLENLKNDKTVNPVRMDLETSVEAEDFGFRIFIIRW